MNKTLTIAYSPCPNDTFIFYALVHNLIDSDIYRFKPVLEDVETLNQNALQGTYDISKLSFAALGHVLDKYALLRSGAALGRGCGPLIVAKPGFGIEGIEKSWIAVPGMMTTAYLLVSLFLSKKPNAFAMPFDKIMPAVKSKKFDYGVIIHEGRFTYKEYGLKCLIDLGEWWEKKTSLPIPLGGIAIKRNLGYKAAELIEQSIRKSIKYSFENEHKPTSYIKSHANEMTLSVINQHIKLYVNDFSFNLGSPGRQAIKTLFDMSIRKKIMPKSRWPLFI